MYILPASPYLHHLSAVELHFHWLVPLFGRESCRGGPVPVQNLVAISPELLSVFVKSNLSSVPIEETDSEVSFQFADILADGRLTYALQLRCLRKRQGSAQSLENPQSKII